MASSAHRLYNPRQTVARAPFRSFYTSRLVRNDAASHAGVTPVQKRPIGGIRGGIIGFFIGFAIASSFSAYYLLDEYKRASAALQTAVDELQRNTEKVSGHIRRIESVEKDLKALSDTCASKEDISGVRSEFKKLYDGLHVGELQTPSRAQGQPLNNENQIYLICDLMYGESNKMSTRCRKVILAQFASDLDIESVRDLGECSRVPSLLTKLRYL